MKPTIIANWKMKLGYKESISLTNKIRDGLIKKENKIYERAIGIKNKWARRMDIVLCPSFISIAEVRKNTYNAGIKMGAQDIFWEEKGAYTGEISASMLKELSVEYVIIGHSERRQYLSETDEIVHKKLKLAFGARLIPILCIGETFEERKAGQKDYVIIKQLIKALEGIELDKEQKLIIGYEPVWVIGSGQAVAPEEAELSAQLIKKSLLDLFEQEFIDNNINVVYGGSVTSNDSKGFLKQPNIKGLLIGGASLDAEEFLKIAGSVE